MEEFSKEFPQEFLKKTFKITEEMLEKKNILMKELLKDPLKEFPTESLKEFQMESLEPGGNEMQMNHWSMQLWRSLKSSGRILEEIKIAEWQFLKLKLA